MIEHVAHHSAGYRRVSRRITITGFGMARVHYASPRH
jgi:hypothetical protein